MKPQKFYKSSKQVCDTVKSQSKLGHSHSTDNLDYTAEEKIQLN